MRVRFVLKSNDSKNKDWRQEGIINVPTELWLGVSDEAWDEDYDYANGCWDRLMNQIERDMRPSDPDWYVYSKERTYD